MAKGKTIIQLPSVATQDLVNERNAFLLFNVEDNRTYKVNDLQMDERFLSSNSVYGNNLRHAIDIVSQFPIAVGAGNDIVLPFGEFDMYSSLSGRIDLVNYDTNEVNTYRFSYQISDDTVYPFEFVWNENHTLVEKGVTPWFVGKESNQLVIRIGTQRIDGSSTTILINTSDISLGI